MKKQLLFESNKGVFFYKETTGAFATVKVQVKRTKRMFTLMCYDYPNIPLQVASPLLSWENLNCCNGWTYDEAYLLTAVQEGKKPYAGCSRYLSTPDDFNDAKAYLAKLKATLPEDCTAGQETSRNSKFFPYFICRQGCLKDLYNLDEVLNDYERLGVEFSRQDCQELRRYFSIPLSTFATDYPFPYCNADSISELITTGLLLGYPIESTYAIL